MIHTFQLVTPPLSFNQYRRIENCIYQHAEHGLCKIVKHQENLLIFLLPGYPGLRLCLNSLTVPHIGIIVNPAIILGGGYSDLCSLSLESLNVCMELISSVLQEFEVEFAADQLILSRIDCTVDVKFPKEDALAAFISCIQRTDPPRSYHVERFNKRHPNHKEMNRHSFRMACNDVCLTVYDKTFQLMNEGLMDESSIPPDRLRFEAAFCNPAFQRLFAKYGGGIFLDGSSEPNLETVIIGFSNLSLRLLQDYFGQHMTPGQYLRGDLALQRIDSVPFSAKVKSRMKLLLAEVARCHKGGISAALKNLEGDGFNRNELRYLLKCFEKIDLNPATINVSAGHEVFPSITELLNGEEHFVKPFSLSAVR